MFLSSVSCNFVDNNKTENMKRFIFTIVTFLNLSLVVLAQGPNGSGTYYQDANGKKGQVLMEIMCQIINPHTRLSYDQLWQCYKTTDRRADGKLWDIYSDKTDYEIGGSAQGANIHEEGVSYNREHVFPKSWFGGKVYPMYSDLMHVMPVDGYVNMRHSNYPFGTTNGEKYKSHNGFSKLGTCNYSYGGSQAYTGVVFEPADEYKGDVARIYFYMLTCYNDQITTWTYYDAPEFLDGNKYPGLQPWALDMLMNWAKNDPVSQKEIDRNNAVYEWQKNRNPYVDYPGLEEYVWGSNKEKTFSYDDYEGGGGDTPVPPTPPTDTYSIVPNKALFDVSKDGQQPTEVRELKGQREITNVGIIGVSVNRNSSGTQMYVKDDHVRVYSGYSIIITVPEDKEIVSVGFVYDKANQPTKTQSYTCDKGYYDVSEHTWKGVPTKEVTLTAKGKFFIKTLNVRLRDKKNHTYTSTVEIKNGYERVESDLVYVGDLLPSYNLAISEGYDQTITAVTSDYAVATAAVSGNMLNVTPIGRGKADITVLLAEDDVWSPASATIQLVVKEHPEDIQLGEPMFFTADDSELTGSYVSDDVRFSGTYVTVNRVMKSNGFQLETKDGCITFPKVKSANGYKVVINTTSGNHDNAVATVQIGDEEAQTCKGKSQTLEVATTSTASAFSIKNNSGNALYLESIAIVPREVINVSANSYDEKTASYYATYYNDVPFELPEGMCGYYVHIEDEKLVITRMFEEGGMVPGETGVLLKSSESGKLYYWASESTAESTMSNSTELGTGANMLRGSVEDDYVDDGDFIYYMLSKPAGKKIGFYWGAANGAAFINKAHKAYLPIPKEQAATLSLDFPFADAKEEENVTAIEDVVMPIFNSDASSYIYSIDGQRLSTLRKGINIVGGKKVIISK